MVSGSRIFLGDIFMKKMKFQAVLAFFPLAISVLGTASSALAIDLDYCFVGQNCSRVSWAAPAGSSQSIINETESVAREWTQINPSGNSDDLVAFVRNRHEAAAIGVSAMVTLASQIRDTQMRRQVLSCIQGLQTLRQGSIRCLPNLAGLNSPELLSLNRQVYYHAEMAQHAANFCFLHSSAAICLDLAQRYPEYSNGNRINERLAYRLAQISPEVQMADETVVASRPARVRTQRFYELHDFETILASCKHCDVRSILHNFQISTDQEIRSLLRRTRGMKNDYRFRSQLESLLGELPAPAGAASAE